MGARSGGTEEGAREIERARRRQVCFHSGSAGTSERSESAKRIAKAITDALEAVDSSTRAAHREHCGRRPDHGKTADEIAEILSHVPKSLRARTGYGLDTCHLYCSGYDITESKKDVHRDTRRIRGEDGGAAVVLPPERQRGCSRIQQGQACTHRGRPDRRRAVRWLLQDAGSKDVPLVLETPQKNYDIADDDPSPDPYDVRMMELLRLVKSRFPYDDARFSLLQLAIADYTLLA